MSAPTAPTAWYHGRAHRAGETAQVLVTDHPEPGAGTVLRAVIHIPRHSPTGMAWGYLGSGAADLALSVLVDAVWQGQPPCPCVLENRSIDGACLDCGTPRLPYQEFKEQFVATWPEDGAWALPAAELRAWLTEPR